MNNFKEHDVVMIAIDKASTISKFQNKDKLEYSDYLNMGDYVVNRQAQHLYIISDDEIKVGEWGMVNTGLLLTPLLATKENILKLKDYSFKKIIATTDNSLTFNNLIRLDVKRKIETPQIPQSFIEHYIAEYNKSNVITKVMVEYFVTHETGYDKPLCIKLNPDNTINIKPIKDNWNREEVVQLLLNCCGEVSCDDGILLGKTPSELFKWIERNL
jgi:hypothetical protein